MVSGSSPVAWTKNSASCTVAVPQNNVGTSDTNLDQSQTGASDPRMRDVELVVDRAKSDKHDLKDLYVILFAQLFGAFANKGIDIPGHRHLSHFVVFNHGHDPRLCRKCKNEIPMG